MERLFFCMKFLLVFIFIIQSVFAVYDVALRPKSNPSFDQKQHAQKINEKFINGADANDWDGRFSSEQRDVFIHKNKIVEQMNIQDGEHVVDLGAGTGVFISDFLNRVGSGKVYALEISDSFINFLNKKNDSDWQRRVEVIKSTSESTTLADASVNVIFLCDVFHHFENINAMLNDFKRILKRPGRVIIVDFDRKNGKATPFILSHQPFSKDDHVKYFENVGFQFTGEKDAELTQNFMMEFVLN